MATDDENGSSPGDERKRPRSKRKPTLGNPDADPQRIHREYVERHLGGGREATPEAYERGVEQWQRLPGAVTRAPAEVKAPGDVDDRDTGDEGGEDDQVDLADKQDGNDGGGAT